MREIKFRGWSEQHNRWVYGFYAVQHEKVQNNYNDLIDIKLHYAIFNDHPDFKSTWGYWQEVVEKSVGQFTGKLDINDKEIYEGDIISASTSFKGEKRRFWVGYSSIDCTFVLVGKMGSWIPFEKVHNIAVIGNLYNNPDLMEN